MKRNPSSATDSACFSELLRLDGNLDAAIKRNQKVVRMAEGTAATEDDIRYGAFAQRRIDWYESKRRMD